MPSLSLILAWKRDSAEPEAPGKSRLTMADFSVLGAAISGSVALPGSDAYKRRVQSVWNGSIQTLRPAAFVFVKNKQDVSETVRFCVTRKLDICAMCGGNSDFALADNAVVVDLSDMRAVTVDVKTKTALVEGGALLCEVDQETVKHKLATSMAGYSKLGVAGTTLFGGGAFLNRLFGSTADNVLEFELVTASGDIIKASATEKSELFWGLKSLGWNYGIVTLMKFQLHDVPAKVIGGSLRYPFTNARNVLKATRDFSRKTADNRLCVYMIINLADHGPEVVLRFLFCGPPSEGEQLVKELQERTGQPSSSSVGQVPLDEFQRSEDGLIPPGLLCHTGKELVFVLDLSDELIESVVESVEKVPDVKGMRNTSVYFQPRGGKLQETHPDGSSNLFGKAEYFVCFVGAAHSQSVFAAMKDWVDKSSKQTSQYAMIPNVEDAMHCHQKLQDLKSQYDPDNAFRHNINIDPNKVEEKPGPC